MAVGEDDSGRVKFVFKNHLGNIVGLVSGVDDKAVVFRVHLGGAPSTFHRPRRTLGGNEVAVGLHFADDESLDV